MLVCTRVCVKGFTDIVSFILCNSSNREVDIIPILQVRKLRFKEVSDFPKLLKYDWSTQNPNPVLCDSIFCSFPLFHAPLSALWKIQRIIRILKDVWIWCYKGKVQERVDIHLDLTSHIKIYSSRSKTKWLKIKPGVREENTSNLLSILERGRYNTKLKS